MVTILIRTVMIYLSLLFAMRLMGKRQLGELEISELITTIMLSEIASLPITNQEIPVMFAIIPIVTILTFEVSLSVIQLKFPKVRRILEDKPSMLINKGKIDRKELKKNRVSADELFAQLRQKDITDPREVYYAILEQNGSLTVIPRAEYKPATVKDMNIKSNESGFMHIIICDGMINRSSLDFLGLDDKWLGEQIKKYGGMENIFLLCCDESGKTSFTRKERKIK